MPEALMDRLPNSEEQETARAAVKAMSKMARDGVLPLVLENAEEVTIELPPKLSEAVMELLALMASGKAVTLVPIGSELTTQQAADILNISRPHLIKLINRGVLTCTKVGRHRRLQAEEVLAYRERSDTRKTEALKELADLGQEFDAS